MPLPTDHFAAPAELLDSEHLTALLEQSGVAARAHATYLRIKPGAGALVGVELRHSATAEPHLGYLRMHPPERSRELAAKWAAKGNVSTPLGDGVRLLAGDRGVLFLFPNDAVLRDLDVVAEPRKLKRLLAELPEFADAGWRVRARASTFTTVRYKPERRLIQRARLALRNDASGADAERRVFLRFFVDTRGERLVRLLHELRAQGLAANTPAPLGAAFEGRLFVEEEIPGHELLADAAHDPQVADEVASILTRLHQARCRGLPSQTPDAVCANAAEGASALAVAMPEAAPALRALMRRLYALAGRAPQGSATLHGDCHLHQFLRNSSGLVLVDFERACTGDAAFDLGHLRAHAHSTGLRQAAWRDALATFAARVVDSYRDLAPGTDLRALPLYTACGLLDRALLPYRHLEPNWRQTTMALIDAALDACAHAPTPTPTLLARGVAADEEHVFYPQPGPTWPGHTIRAEQRHYGRYDHLADRFVAVEPRADDALPGLRAWPDAELIAYRAGRRATLRTRQPDAFVKVVAPNKLPALEARWRFAGGQTAFPVVPQVLASNPELGTLITEPMAGESLHAVLMRGDASELLPRLAGAVVALHRTPGATTLPARSAERALSMWVGFVARHDGALADLLALALDELAALPPSDAEASALVHGDLHDRNVILTARGVGLIDLDGLGAGDAHDDVGNLAAHFLLRTLQRGGDLAAGLSAGAAWLDAYATAAGDHDLHASRAAMARAALRLACLYRFRSRWAALAQPLCAGSLRIAQECRSTP